MFTDVQNVKEWELAIRDITARKLYDVYLTGSDSDLLSSGYTTHLGGRFNTIRMLPLSYAECLEFQKMFGGADGVFHTFVRTGGFPILWRNPTDIQSDMQTVRDIVDIPIANDIEERFGIKNKQLLKNLLGYTRFRPVETTFQPTISTTR